MRLLFFTILFAMLFPGWSPADELVPGVLAFDPPAFLSEHPAGHDTTNSENAIRVVRRYAASDNDPRTSQRLLTVAMRALKPTAAEMAANGNFEKVLGAEMQAAVTATRNAVNVSSVTNVEVGGHPAWLVSCEIHRPYWQKPEDALFPCEVYWIKIQTNQVAEIKLIADSAEHLQTLKDCLPRFKITTSRASFAKKSTGDTP